MKDNEKNSKWKTTKKIKVEDDQISSEWKTTKRIQSGRQPKQ